MKRRNRLQRFTGNRRISSLPAPKTEAVEQNHRANEQRQRKSVQARPIVANEPRTPPFYDPDLPILVAMSALMADSKDTLKSSGGIAGKMSPSKSADEIKKGLKRLLVGGYVRSLSHGNRGGYWLTAKGRNKLPSAKAKRKTR